MSQPVILSQCKSGIYHRTKKVPWLFSKNIGVLPKRRLCGSGHEAKLKMCDNGLINECLFNLNIFTEIPSNPGEESSLK